MPLPRPAKPKVLLADIRALLKERSPVQAVAAAAAVLVPASILTVFYFDAQTNIAPPPQVIYVESWPADRTDAEIAAAQADRQRVREAIQAERQRQFQRLDNSMERLGL